LAEAIDSLTFSIIMVKIRKKKEGVWMMKMLRWINTGYLLGFVLILAAAAYFFAANWPSLGRYEKIALSVLLMVGLYGLSWLIHRSGRREFLAKTLFVGGLIAFGLTIALLGQIYNSHADSYSLFVVWFIPAFVYSLATRYHPFYMIAYVLGHIALLLYGQIWIGMGGFTDEQVSLVTGIAVVLVNVALFYLTWNRRVRSLALEYASFWMTHLVLLYLSISYIFEHSYWIFNVVAVAAIVGSFFGLKRERNLLASAGVFAALFLIVKYIELAAHFHSLGFYYLGLAFLVALLYGNIRLVKGLLKEEKPDGASKEVPEASHKEAPKGVSKAPEKDSGPAIVRILTAVALVVGVFIGTVTVVQITDLLFKNGAPTETIVFGIGLAATFLVLVLSSFNPLVRSTLMYCGLIWMLFGSVWADSTLMTAIALILTALSWWLRSSQWHRYPLYVLLNLAAMALLWQLKDPAYYDNFDVVLTLAIANIVLYMVLPRFTRAAGKASAGSADVSGIVAFLLWFFVLTFFEAGSWVLYAVINLAFFAVVTGLAFHYQRVGRRFLFAVSLAFWFGFLFYKYYDFLWKLIHKSITLALLGLLLLIATYLVERRTNATWERTASFLDRNKLGLALVIVLQLGFVGYQISASETILANGKVIKLELLPVDPRSLLQGDYMQLNYKIAHPPGETEPDLWWGGVKVAIAPDSQGVYQWQRELEGDEPLREGEIMIRGKRSYMGIEYGIERFYIPEGTGAEVAQKAKHAEVRVGGNGNALLVRLME
jgi:uncharacterized membrane-anchored protein/uncharacterized membrane protein